MMLLIQQMTISHEALKHKKDQCLAKIKIKSSKGNGIFGVARNNSG